VSKGGSVQVSVKAVIANPSMDTIITLIGGLPGTNKSPGVSPGRFNAFSISNKYWKLFPTFAILLPFFNSTALLDSKVRAA